MEVTDRDNVKRLLDLSDGAIAYSARGGAGGAIYETVGYKLLDDFTAQVKHAIASRRLVKDTGESQFIVSALAKRGYIVGFPTSRLEKLIRHIKANNWPYIADRLWKEMRSHIALLVTFALLSGLMLALWRMVRLARRSGKDGYTKAHSSQTTMIICFLLVAMGSVSDLSAQALSEQQSQQYYDGEMTIKRLYQGAQEIGSTVWLKRGSDKIKAKYFAYGQVSQKYSAFNQQIILACAGAFTERSGATLQPQGLTVDNGAIVNRDLNGTMDGLVIVYQTGGIVISDIEKDWLSVEENGTKQSLNILISEHKTAFLNWAQRNKATVFQTQLLASPRGLRLDVLKAQREFRERRLLAIVRDAQTKEVIHVVFNIPKAFYLGPLTQLVYDHLRKTTEVVGLLNLDTGDYDILQVKTPTGESLSSLNGPKPIGIATNLLVYYYAKN